MALQRSLTMAVRLQCRDASHFAKATPSPTALKPTVRPLPSSPAEGELLPYHVSRTESQQLPVYRDLKNGNRKLTLVRKIVGDVPALKRELQEFLGLAEDRIAINSLTKHIVIKGWHKPEIIKFLEAKKF